MTPQAQLETLTGREGEDNALAAANAAVMFSKTHHYQQRLDVSVDPVHRPEGITMADYISLLAAWRARHTIPQVACDEIIAIVQNALLREQRDQRPSIDDNNAPPTTFIADKLLEVGTAKSLRYHICQCEQYAWPPYTGNLTHVKHHMCPHPNCGMPHVTRCTRTGKYKPHKSFYYFGLQHAISHYMFGNKDWAMHRASPAARANTFFTSNLANRLRGRFGDNVINDRDVSPYVLGIDGF